MSGELKTQGTKLYFIDPSGELATMSCPTGITGLGGAKGQIPSTCLDDTEDEQFLAGLGVPGQVNVPFVFKPGETNQRDLIALKASGDTTRWMIGFSDGVGLPTHDSNGTFTTPPVDRTSAEFTAYVADITFDLASNDIVRGTMLLQRSGSVVWNWV